VKLSRPKQITWILAVILGIIGFLAYLLGPGALGFWFLLVAWLLLVLGTALAGL
jgi:hypothetical protein